ncbi:hypothetical protein V2J09_009726, partial [Rumex salicifolius]
DRVDGLHVFKDDQWFRANVIPDAIFVNAVHRSVTNAERERLSLAMFVFPSNDTEIEPFKELISSDRPQSYKKVKNYIDLLFQHYQKRKMTLDTVRI